MSDIEQERSEWFSKIQKERTVFVLDIELQKKELENCIEKKQEERESYLKQKEKAFVEEKKNELEYMSSALENFAEEAKQIGIKMGRLGEERKAINMDRERRDKELAELNSSVEELKLKKLEDAKAVPFRITASEIEECDSYSQKQSRRYVKRNTKLDLVKKIGGDGPPPLSAPLGWLKRPASSLLEQTESNKKRKQQKDADQSLV
nr:hypothetical protein [Tanacetum cinerariifolium]